jgi:hypothetical protein
MSRKKPLILRIACEWCLRTIPPSEHFVSVRFVHSDTKEEWVQEICRDCHDECLNGNNKPLEV